MINPVSFHKKTRGKIEIKPKIILNTKKDWSLAYTPGVGDVCLEIARDKQQSWKLTNRSSQVAIVSDGTAVLGLGNIGPEAGMPVMEGKSVIFKQLANIDAIPLCINTFNTQDIIKFCQMLEPSFAGINLEDIAAPACFEILEELEKTLLIPVFHDDQDGTAIAILAGLINAGKVLKNDIKTWKVVINGAGAAGFATTRLLLAYGIKNIVLLDSKGIICTGRKELNKYKMQIAEQTNCSYPGGGLKEALVKADCFIGLAKGGLMSQDFVKLMAPKPVIFALANPIPEIFPKDAYAAGAALVATGRSDYPNQINNALVFPGIFRGLLNKKINHVTQEMKLRAAEALAAGFKPTKNKLLPSVQDKKVVSLIAQAI